MKSTLTRITPILGSALCVAVLLGGCGQPGPLYLPKAPTKSASSTSTSKPGVPPASSPVPGTAPSSQQ
ncbi:hypothetical protein HSX11_22540 [Oxalobacteraceae bacterium]|nr:hypothetical protein [Oxalobacteraceae bacterium]